MCRCALEKDPARRPDAELMLHHPWVLHNLAMRRRGVVCEPTPLRSLLCAEERRLLQSGTVVDQTGMRPQQRDDWGGRRTGPAAPAEQSEVVHRESQALRDGVEAERRNVQQEEANEANAQAHFKQAEVEFKQRRRNLVVANERERAKSASASKRRLIRSRAESASRDHGEARSTVPEVVSEQKVWQESRDRWEESCGRVDLGEPIRTLQWGQPEWAVPAPTISFKGHIAESFAGW